MSEKPQKSGAKRWRRRLRRIIVLLIVLILVAALGWYGYSRLKQEYTVTYDGYTAAIGSISNALSFSGSLGLIDSASYNPSASTTVRNIYVSVGDEVKDGDKLIRLANGETIEAEFDGRVNKLGVEAGQSVTQETQLIQVADFSHLQVSLRVDEYDIADVQVGQACSVTATATEKSFDSEIASIDYISASGGSVAYYTAVCYVDVDAGVYPGMQVTVSIPQEEANDVVVLKMDALSFDESNSAYVWKYDDAGELEQVYVEVGVSNGNYVEIKSGLSDGDEVYVEAAQTETSSGLGGLLSGLFGGNQMNAPTGGMGGRDMADFDMSSMPDMGSFNGGDGASGGTRPSFGGGNG